MAGQFQFIDLKPTGENFLDAVKKGLGSDPKTLPAKFFYDQKGSNLFEEITNLPEYYPTRTEKKLLARIGPKLALMLPKRATLVEFGAGSTEKVRVFIDAVGNFETYVPIDISRDYLELETEDLASDHPNLSIVAICADYTTLSQLPPEVANNDRLVGFFPGSTIGNMTPEEAGKFLGRIARLLGKGAGLIIGADLQKDPEILNAAYNDKKKVTAAFNLNILARINRELGGDFNLDAFEHLAFYNETKHRIEMHLKSKVDQWVKIGGTPFHFQKGETIHTENSYKFTKTGFEDLAKFSGFNPIGYWQDDRALFSIHYLEVTEG